MPGNRKWTEQEKDPLWKALERIVAGKSIDGQILLLVKQRRLRHRTAAAIRRKLFYLKKYVKAS